MGGRPSWGHAGTAGVLALELHRGTINPLSLSLSLSLSRQVLGGSPYPSDGDLTLYDYAVMLRGDLDNAKKTIVRLRTENKEVKELKQQLVECREALDASMEREHGAELRGHEHRRRFKRRLTPFERRFDAILTLF